MADDRRSARATRQDAATMSGPWVSCRNCDGSGKSVMFLCGHDYDENGEMVNTGGAEAFACESCFGLGRHHATQPRLFKQTVARAVYAKLTKRGENIFQVLSRINDRHPLGDSVRAPINRQMIAKALDGLYPLTVVFPNGLILRSAREVMREFER